MTANGLEQGMSSRDIEVIEEAFQDLYMVWYVSRYYGRDAWGEREASIVHETERYRKRLYDGDGGDTCSCLPRWSWLRKRSLLLVIYPSRSYHRRSRNQCDECLSPIRGSGPSPVCMIVRDGIRAHGWQGGYKYDCMYVPDQWSCFYNLVQL